MRRKTRIRSGHGAVGGRGSLAMARGASVLGVCAIGGLTAPVAGQTEDTPSYPPLRWFAQESIDSHAEADDQAMDIGYWNNGSPAGNFWPDDGWGDGVRRYNNELEDGDDLAVELGPTIAAEEDPDDVLTAVVLGTSWGGSSKFDYVTLAYGGPDGDLIDKPRYDNGDNDIATGICGFAGQVWVTGYSEEPASSFGPGGPQLNTDYLTISYDFYFDPLIPYDTWWTERRDVGSAGLPDYPYDIQFGSVSGHKFVWVTGTGSNGVDYDLATVRYEHDFSPGPQSSWMDAWGISTHAETGRALVLAGDHPYIAGRLKASNSDHMLGLKYEPSGTTPPYQEDWYKLFRNDSYGSGVEHEGRAIVKTALGVFIAGVSKASGEGKQFTTWRYEE